MDNNIDKAKKWVQLDLGDNFLSDDEHCPTRDIFQARLDKIRIALENRPGSNLNLIYPLIAVIGEIGNNAYDHNLGKWRDAMGIYFDIDGKTIVIADRGQGILSSIQKVKSEIKADIEALRVAFTQTISGRFPEKRGNGLKFVVKVAQDLGLDVIVFSGNAMAKIENKILTFENSDQIINGVLAIIKY